MVSIKKLEKFVESFYQNKDMMHNLSHIKRTLKAVKKITNYYNNIDRDLIVYSAYFHGIIYEKENLIRKFLETEGLSGEKINKIIQVSWESQKEKIPETLEGKILHDAHLIEGGTTFLIVKSLITGTLRGQTLEETIEYIEKNILGKFSCYLPETKGIYNKKEKFAKKFLEDLKENL
ncbi:hypothetical protein JYK00_09340 [Thermosipho ferrireducens]|uniref:HD domain-containing protein n=1 Tax=Thermosipho ferrireducens TaxID=2571116 RepID=A0ABX7S976_9BACT|nr:hypothetical protein [Thermosipho ferrireducens]QTA37906.1 hypothetical protein JYK00_09340 [Thermosipho ferrireducens]